MLGAAGLGKTAIVKSVARQLVASGSSGSRFSAIVFVELRARETEDAVRSAVRDAIKTAGVGSSDPMTLPHDALLILDNADDPYKLKNDDGWFEKRILPELDAWGCTIFMTMRYACPAHILAPHQVGSYRTLYVLCACAAGTRAISRYSNTCCKLTSHTNTPLAL